MRLDEIRPSEGSKVKSRKRVGRGTGSGLGKTSGRGQKGQNARSGGGVRPGFEGGQMPLFRRMPKRGFTNIFAKKYAIVKISDLNAFESGATVTENDLLEAGIIKKLYDGVKLLSNGEIEKKLTVKVTKASAAAVKKIEAAGGKIEVI